MGDLEKGKDMSSYTYCRCAKCSVPKFASCVLSRSKHVEAPPANLAGRLFVVGVRGVKPAEVVGRCGSCKNVLMKYSSGFMKWTHTGTLNPAKTTTTGNAGLLKAAKEMNEYWRDRQWAIERENIDKVYPADPFGDQRTNNQTTKEGNDDMTKVLYEIATGEDNKVTYGHKLTTNSKGMWVMELKGGNGAIVTVAKSDVTEVMPYTIDVVFLGTYNKPYSFFANADKFAVGDLVFAEEYGSPVKVVAVDTKSRKATVGMNGWIMSNDYVKYDAD